VSKKKKIIPFDVDKENKNSFNLKLKEKNSSN